MLRSFRLGRATTPASKSASLTVRRFALLLATTSAVGLGGCSADFLRFDAPVFSLNDGSDAAVRPAAAQEPAYAPSGSALADARRDDYSGSDYPGYRAPVERAERRVLSESTRSNEVALSVPSAQAPAPAGRRYADATPLATGALGSARSITVERGDTLYQLSRRHGVSVEQLRVENNLTGDIIRPGQTLRLPGGGGRVVMRDSAPEVRAASRPITLQPQQTGGGVVTVAPGDSLYAISRRTGVSVSELKRLNGITDVRRLQPGMQLRLGGTAVAAPAATRMAPEREQRSQARTDFGQAGRIQTKPIRTVSIGRDMAPAASTAPSSVTTPSAAPTSAATPRILNGDGAASAAPASARESADEDAGRDEPVKFRWPAKGRIIATFNNSGRGVKNDGINISLPIGTPIHAVESGTVAYAGSELKGYGNLVLLRHENGWVSAYAHASELLVKRGDKVEKGQVIAKAGRSGGVTQPQLHFELRRQATPVDPLPHLAQM